MLYFTDFAKFSYIYNSVLKSQVSFTKNTQKRLPRRTAFELNSE